MLKKLLILIASIAILCAPLSVYAQVFSQSQIISSPFGLNGFVVSTTTANGAKLSATSTPFFSNFFATNGTVNNLIATASSTIGDGTPKGGLTVLGNSTTTGTLTAGGGNITNLVGVCSDTSPYGTCINTMGVITGAGSAFDAHGYRDEMTMSPSANVTAPIGYSDNPVLSNSSAQINNYDSFHAGLTIEPSYTGPLINVNWMEAGFLSNSSANPIGNQIEFEGDNNTNGNGTTTGEVDNFGLRQAGFNASSSGSALIQNYSAYLTVGHGAPTGGVTNDYGLYITGNGGTSANGGIENAYAIYSNSTSNSYINGNIGIGTTTPDGNLTVLGDSSTLGKGTINLVDGNGREFALRLGTGTFDFNIDSESAGVWTTDLTIKRSNGNVGIGTTTPATILSLAGTTGIFASTTATSTFQGGSINLIPGAGKTGCYAINGACIGSNSGTVTSVSTDSTLTGGPITTTGTLGINLTNSNTWTGLQTFNASPISAVFGNKVGIGTSTPLSDLEVFANSIGIKQAAFAIIGNAPTSEGPNPEAAEYINGGFTPQSGLYVIDNQGALKSSSSGDFRGYYSKIQVPSGVTLSGNLYNMYLDAPTISGTLSGSQYALYSADSSNSYFAGNVGLGTTSPYAQLSIGGGNLVVGAATAGGSIGDLFLPKLGNPAGSFLAIDPTGKVISTSTPSTGTVTSVSTDSTLTGGPITSTGTLGINLTNTNTWSGSQMFIASTTIGKGTPGNGLTISGSATTTGTAYFAGQIGVGTSTPLSNLEIFSNSLTTKQAIFSLIGNAPTSEGPTPAAAFYLNGGFTPQSGLYAIDNQAAIKSNTSLDFRGYYSKLQVPAAVTVTGNLYNMYLDTPTISGAVTGSQYALYAADTNPSYFAGQIGVATTTPDAPVTVFGSSDTAGSGNINLTTGLGREFALRLNTSANGSNFNIDSEFSGAWSTPFMIMRSTGNVGISTSTPDSTLDVNGNVRLEGSSSFVTAAIGGAIVSGGCDSVTTTGLDSTMSSTTAFITTPQADPGSSLGGTWTYSFLAGSGKVTTRVCSNVTVTPNSVTYQVKIIK